jgi:hypothetical protein
VAASSRRPARPPRPKAAKARIAAGKAGKAKGAQTAAGKARAALSKTARAEAAAAKAAPPRPAPTRRAEAGRAKTTTKASRAKTTTTAPRSRCDEGRSEGHGQGAPKEEGRDQEVGRIVRPRPTTPRVSRGVSIPGRARRRGARPRVAVVSGFGRKTPYSAAPRAAERRQHEDRAALPNCSLQ